MLFQEKLEHGLSLIETDAIEGGVDVISDIVPLFYAIQDHAFGNRDHLRQDLMQDADNGALVAIIRAGVGDKGKEFIRQFLLVGEEAEDIGHALFLNCSLRNIIRHTSLLLRYIADSLAVKQAGDGGDAMNEEKL